MTPTNSRNLWLLSFTLIVVMLGFGMVMPIFPFLLTQMGGSGDEYGLLIAVAAFTQLIFAPIWGRISDRAGRKPVLLVGVLGSGLTVLLFGVSTRLWMLFVGRALSGLLASAVAPAAMAYIGDSTSEKDRGGGIGKLGGAMALGVILGPGLGGWLAGDSLTQPFFIAAALSAVSFGLILWLLPESLPRSERSGAAYQTGQTRLFDWGFLGQALAGPLGLLLWLAFLVSFGATCFQAIFGLYAMHRLDFNPQQVGAILVVVGLVSAIIQGGLTGPLTRRYGEILLIKVFLLANALGFLVLLLAGSYTTMLLTTGVYILSHALLRPSIQSLTSRRADESNRVADPSAVRHSGMGQGTAMGLNNAFISLGQIAGPIWAGIVFDLDIRYPYLSGALILLVGFVLSLLKLHEEQSVERPAKPAPGW